MQEWSQLKYSLIICSLVTMIYLIKVGSLNSEKNPKTEEELSYRRRWVRLFSVVYSIVASGLFMASRSDIGTIIVCTQIYTAIAVWVAKHKKGVVK